MGVQDGQHFRHTSHLPRQNGSEGHCDGGCWSRTHSCTHRHVRTRAHTHTHTRQVHTHAHLSFPKGITFLPAQGALCCLRQRTAFTISHVPAGCPSHARCPPGAGSPHRWHGESPCPRGGTGNRQLGKERNQTKAGETCVSSPKESREPGRKPGDVSHQDPTPTSP